MSTTHKEVKAMASSPEVGSSEGGAGKAQPSWGAVPAGTAQALGSTALTGYVSGQTATAAAIGSTAVGGASK